MSEIFFGSVCRDPRTGELGARVIVRVDGSYAGRYSFDTHGMSPDDVTAKIAELQVYHDKKCARLAGFAGVIGVEFVIGGRVFRIIDCTITEVGGQPELYVDVRELVGNERVPAGSDFPLRLRFASIGDVHENATIVALARGLAQSQIDTAAAHAAFTSRVTTLMRPAKAGGTQ